MARILIIDEEGPVRNLLKYTLQREGFEVECASEESQILDQLNDTPPDLIILYVYIVRLDGWDLIPEIRKQMSSPILLIGVKGDHTDAVRGFELGVDDYVSKPFHPDELVLRVKALLRRYGAEAFAHIAIGDFMIDRAMHEVRIHGQSLCLPLKEFQLLFMLASYPNQILTRKQLIEQIWGANYEGGERTVDVHIKRLRSKLSAYSDSMRFTTVRGLGYRLDVH